MTAKAPQIPYYQALCALLRDARLPLPTPEYRFDPARRWRFDFAWPDAQVAIEIDGGIWINGGHNRGKALLAQYEKQNAAAIAGWRVLRYSPKQLTTAVEDVAMLLILIREDK